MNQLILAIKTSTTLEKSRPGAAEAVPTAGRSLTRQDDPAEVYLLDKAGKVVDSTSWQAGYELSQTLLAKITDLLKKQGQVLADLSGVVVYNAGGGFTSLRLGVLTANALAYGLEIPVVGVSGTDWLPAGAKKLASVESGQWVKAKYDRPPHITQPKK